MPPAAILDPETVDTSKVLYGRDAIREGNPQRFEMEQLDAIVHFDASRKIIAGYKDVSGDEFWIRGHMPGYPIMPGVLMCEAAAQLASYYCHLTHAIKDGFLGFGGMEDVRFRGTVHVGDRLLIIAKAVRLHRLQNTFDTQGFVGPNMVFHARVIGVLLSERT
jgi:3-hydroxyacyl-[acyl-carrier-protein] dehydratase